MLSEVSKDPRTVCLIHGYGVRSPFWRAMKTRLERHFARVKTPDLNMRTIDSGIDEVRELCLRLREESGESVILVGHSLGGVVSAMATKALDVATVCHLVVIAAPFGDSMKKSLSPLLRFALRFKLIPAPLLRRRFFGPRTPAALQKELFANSVDETKEVRDVGREDTWFHTHEFEGGLPQKSLVIASSLDRIVNPTQTLAFAEALGAETHLFPRSTHIGHDDFGILPAAANETAKVIEEFLSRHPVPF